MQEGVEEEQEPETQLDAANSRRPSSRGGSGHDFPLEIRDESRHKPLHNVRKHGRHGSRHQGSRRGAASQLIDARFPTFVTPQRFHGFLSTLAALSLLGCFSFLGLLARLGLIAINTFNGREIFPILWAQIVGCAVMGLVTSRKTQIEELYLPLYTGLTTGLAGSITSFSSWMSGIFMAWAQIDAPPHGGFHNVCFSFRRRYIQILR